MMCRLNEDLMNEAVPKLIEEEIDDQDAQTMNYTDASEITCQAMAESSVTTQNIFEAHSAITDLLFVTDGQTAQTCHHQLVLHSLFEACMEGCLDSVMTILRETPQIDINMVNSTGHMPLVASCWRGNLAIVERLVQQSNCNINQVDSYGHSPLLAACVKGYLDIVKCLTQLSADVNMSDTDGRTPLILACRKQHLTIAMHLLAIGTDVNVNAQDNNLNTALHYCVSQLGGDGWAKLHKACNNNNTGELLDLVFNCGESVNVQNNVNDTPLHIACRRGHEDVVSLLLQVGSDVKIVNDDGLTALQEAQQQKREHIVNLFDQFSVNQLFNSI